MATVLLSLGSNIGDRLGCLHRAIERLPGAGIIPIRVSGVYETAPVGEAAGPDWFLNIAAAGRTDLPPLGALGACLAVERAEGRRRDLPGGPRTIDVDLLCWEDAVLDGPGLVLPHPRMHLRRFVLAPLAEVAPDWRHPLLGATVVGLLEALGERGTVRRAGDWGADELPDAQAPDAQTPDAQAPDAQAPDARVPSAGAPDARAPGASRWRGGSRTP